MLALIVLAVGAPIAGVLGVLLGWYGADLVFRILGKKE